MTLATSRLHLRACLKTAHAREATDHQVDHRHPDHRFTGLGEIRVIFGESPVAAEPSERPLDDPPFGEHVEPLEAFESFDHLQADVAPGPQGPHPGSERTRLGLIGPDQPQARNLVPEDR